MDAKRQGTFSNRRVVDLPMKPCVGCILSSSSDNDLQTENGSILVRNAQKSVAGFSALFPGRLSFDNLIRT